VNTDIGTRVNTDMGTRVNTDIGTRVCFVAAPTLLFPSSVRSVENISEFHRNCKMYISIRLLITGKSVNSEIDQPSCLAVPLSMVDFILLL